MLIFKIKILRTTGKCEYTGKDYFRITTYTPLDPRNTNFGLSYEKFSKKYNTPLIVLIVPKFAKVPEEDLRISFKVELSPKDKGSFLKYNRFVHLTNELANNKIRQILKKFYCNRIELGNNDIRLETFRENLKEIIPFETIDDTLRAIYHYCLKKGNLQENISHIITQWRRQIFDINERFIWSEIRVKKNSIAWNYGCVAVLIGNPKQKLAFIKPVHGGQIWDRSSDFDKEEANKLEFALKEPFQVEKGFYQEPVDNEEHLILGKKDLLDKYRTDYRIVESVKSRFVDIESLTLNQKQLFNIPST